METVTALEKYLPKMNADDAGMNPCGQYETRLTELCKVTIVNTCLDATVKVAIDRFFKQNDSDNLAYNHAVFDSSGGSEAVTEYMRHVKAFFKVQSQFYDGISPPTGRYIMNLSSNAE